MPGWIVLRARLWERRICGVALSRGDGTIGPLLAVDAGVGMEDIVRLGLASLGIVVGG